MTYREKPGHCEAVFRRKLKTGLAWCTLLFLIAAVLLVIEVYALLALQFCDGEDLMALYWSTWTMLQLGSEIAILGIDMALWHHLCGVRLPLWALALGTPVLVVAGFGHVIQVALRIFYKRAKAHRRERKASTSEKVVIAASSSSGASVKPGRLQIDDQPGALEAGQAVYFTLDVGDDERVRRWPCFVGMMADGKSLVQATTTECLPEELFPIIESRT
ncbi:hypothetical protein AAE478_002167 [Parahypoxylon ruwenzoriense]